MKKFAMVSLAAAGILLFTGSIFVLISSVAGGYRFSALAREIELDDEIDDVLEDIGEAVYDSTNGKWGHLKEHDSHTVKHHSEAILDEQTDARNIRKMEIEAGACVCTIRKKETADGQIDIIASGTGGCNYSVKGSTLYIEGFSGWSWKDAVSQNLNDNQIEIWIPAGSSLEELEMEVGAGEMNISGINLNKLKTEVGAGMLVLSDMEIRDISVDVGAGKMEAYGITAGEAEFSVAMGECTYQGNIAGKLEAECAMGNMLLELTGSETDHNYEIECSAGNIQVGSIFTATGLACEKTINNHAASTFEIDCGMGNVTVNFEN